MSGYLLALLGVIVIGVIVDVILPSGSTSKYISGMFALFVVLVIVSPIANWVKRDFNISDYFINTSITLDQKLLNSMYSSKVDAIKQDILTELENNGLLQVDIDIKYNVVADNIEIKQILVYLNNLVIKDFDTNINKYVYIRQVVMKHLNITEEVIMFCE